MDSESEQLLERAPETSNSNTTEPKLLDARLSQSYYTMPIR
jgi:hypothetical protein